VGSDEAPGCGHGGHDPEVARCRSPEAPPVRSMAAGATLRQGDHRADPQARGRPSSRNGTIARREERRSFSGNLEFLAVVEDLELAESTSPSVADDETGLTDDNTGRKPQ
jgi:hypothetical protein